MIRGYCLHAIGMYRKGNMRSTNQRLSKIIRDVEEIERLATNLQDNGRYDEITKVLQQLKTLILSPQNDYREQ